MKKNFDEEFYKKILIRMGVVLTNPTELNNAIVDYTAKSPECQRYSESSIITDKESWDKLEIIRFNAAYFDAVVQASKDYYKDAAAHADPQVLAQAQQYATSKLAELTKELEPSQKIYSIICKITAFTGAEFGPKNYVNPANTAYSFFTENSSSVIALTLAAVGLGVAATFVLT